MCAVLSVEKNLSSVELDWSAHFERRGVIDIGSGAIASPENFFNELDIKNANLISVEKLIFNLVRVASGEQVPSDKQAKNTFHGVFSLFRNI